MFVQYNLISSARIDASIAAPGTSGKFGDAAGGFGGNKNIVANSGPYTGTTTTLVEFSSYDVEDSWLRSLGSITFPEANAAGKTIAIDYDTDGTLLVALIQMGSNPRTNIYRVALTADPFAGTPTLAAHTKLCNN